MVYINGKPLDEGNIKAGVAGVKFVYSLDFSTNFNSFYLGVI